MDGWGSKNYYCPGFISFAIQILSYDPEGNNYTNWSSEMFSLTVLKALSCVVLEK